MCEMPTRIKFNKKLLDQGEIKKMILEFLITMNILINLHMHITSNSVIGLPVYIVKSRIKIINCLLIVQKLAMLIMFRNLTIDRCFVVNGTDIAMAKITKRESTRWQH